MLHTEIHPTVSQSVIQPVSTKEKGASNGVEWGVGKWRESKQASIPSQAKKTERERLREWNQ
jgi:hypothetical protein